jgi:hypothetical protein
MCWESSLTRWRVVVDTLTVVRGQLIVNKKSAASLKTFCPQHTMNLARRSPAFDLSHAERIHLIVNSEIHPGV